MSKRDWVPHPLLGVWVIVALLYAGTLFLAAPQGAGDNNEDWPKAKPEQLQAETFGAKKTSHADNHSDTSNDHELKDLAAQQGMERAAWWMVWFTGGTCFLVAVGTVLLYRTLKSTDKTLSEARAATSAANFASQEAKRGNDLTEQLLVGMERPIPAFALRAEVNFEKNLMTVRGQERETYWWKWSYDITVTNHGRSVLFISDCKSRIFQVGARFLCMKEPESWIENPQYTTLMNLAYDRALPAGSSLRVPPGDHPAGGASGADSLDHMYSWRDRPLLIEAVLDYEDALGRRRRLTQVWQRMFHGNFVVVHRKDEMRPKGGQTS